MCTQLAHGGDHGAHFGSHKSAFFIVGGIIACGGMALLAALGLPLVWHFATLLADLMRYPYPADGLEGTLLAQAHLLWSGQQLYPAFELYRFVSAPYPPWHPLILGFADQFAGPHAFWNGRMVSLTAGALVLLVIVVASVRVVAGSLLAGPIAADMPVLHAAVHPLGNSNQARHVCAALDSARAAARVIRAWLGRRTDSRVRLLAATCLRLAAPRCVLALAFFTKQTALAGPLAAGLAFIATELQAWRAMPGRRLALPQTLLFGLSYLALVGVSWLVLDLWSRGQFTFHIWTQHRAAKWSLALMWKYVALLTDYWPLMVLGVSACWRWPGASNRHGLWPGTCCWCR